MSEKIITSSMTAEIIANVDDENHHAQTLRDHMKGATEFTCVVAFARNSGLAMISDLLKDRVKKGMTITIVVGLDFYQTDPDVILNLLKLRALAPKPKAVKVYMGAEDARHTMHPKIYIFRGKQGTTAIVGSANMTQGGFADNWEMSALISGQDINWEKTLVKWIQNRFDDGDIVEANRTLVERYRIKRNIFLANIKIAERRARKAFKSPPGDLGTLRDILAEMKADESDNGFEFQVALRKNNQRSIPAIFKRIEEMNAPTPESFLPIYEKLLQAWHSGGLHRGKTAVASQPMMFRDSLRSLRRSRSVDPDVNYNLLLEPMLNVPRAGVNVITEILHSHDATRYPVMNANSVSGLRLAKISNYPVPLTKKTVDGKIYAQFCKDAERIRSSLKLKDFTELDALFNYAYWRTD
ncbi:phospholipase D-like domain-containing protein [Gluconobacter kondonii]|uniref:phospholipase D-like domain-containing protein n=1 Tax=Gluconobacter kondonii TaxID=941463 RepID=UPI001B8CCEAA|nr:phospholipase D-like domain-containing protein [Gluconobacter kondonii]MBS1081819.1 NgoFVII family restriction endonuclease [Gluconobacter kondonii]